MEVGTTDLQKYSEILSREVLSLEICNAVEMSVNTKQISRLLRHV